MQVGVCNKAPPAGCRTNFKEAVIMIIRENTKEKVNCSTDVAKILMAILASQDVFEQEKEMFWCIGLSAKNAVKFVDLVSLGTLTNSLVHCREVFRQSIHRGVASIIVGHQHPSGDVTPSQDDIAVAKRLVEAGTVLGIRVLDSVIIGIGPDAQHYSMQEAGII